MKLSTQEISSVENGIPMLMVLLEKLNQQAHIDIKKHLIESYQKALDKEEVIIFQEGEEILFEPSEAEIQLGKEAEIEREELGDLYAKSLSTGLEGNPSVLFQQVHTLLQEASLILMPDVIHHLANQIREDIKELSPNTHKKHENELELLIYFSISEPAPKAHQLWAIANKLDESDLPYPGFLKIEAATLIDSLKGNIFGDDALNWMKCLLEG